MSFKQKKIFVSVIFAALLCVLGYFIAANLWNAYRASTLVAEYTESVAETDDSYLEEEYAKAVAYNNGSSQYAYEELLNLSGNGIMGYISIPKIDVELPIYHTVDDDVLQKGVGHMEGTSLPVGGEGTHAVLSGHRGLPGSKLFTDLDQIEINDMFYITVLGQTLAYKVVSIEVVLPTEVDSLTVVEGEDLVTLVTCTPYGVNTHRLLVTGQRVEMTSEEAAAALEEESGFTLNIFTPDNLLYLGFIFILICWALVIRNIKKQEEDFSSTEDLNKILEENFE